MQKNYKNHKFKPIEQISDSHCGPAVLQMLLENVGVESSQENITKAANATSTIEEFGTRVDQLALATYKLAPHVEFWYKENGTLNELNIILNENNYPIGVEWQGLFEDRIEDEEEGYDDYGHYSIISRIDLQKEELIIVDPYKDFVKQDRIVPFNVFLTRWWDWNGIYDPGLRKTVFKKDENLFFIVTMKEQFPDLIGMKKFDWEAL